MGVSRTEQPLRAAVLGSGGISKEHLTYLAGRSPYVQPRSGSGDTGAPARLVGVCDLSQAAASYAAGQYQADGAYTDLGTMLAESQPDVVHILTPPSTHSKLASQCLAAGAHVICEKPITATASELESLLTVATTNRRQIMESHNYRFNRGVERLKEMIVDGSLGSVTEIEIRIVLPVTDPDGRFGDANLPSPIHRMPAGVVHDLTTHFAYLLLYLAEPVEFEKLRAAWNNHSGNPLFSVDDLDALLIGSGPDGPVHARLRFDAMSKPDTFTIRVRGTNGWAETDLFQPYIRAVIPRRGGDLLSPIVNHVANGASLVKAGVRNVGKKLLQQGPYEGLHVMLDRSYQALAEDRPFPVTPEEMLAASRLIDRLLEEEAQL